MTDPLTDRAELLFRQIHPNFLQDGEPASDRFQPQPKDNGLMSLDRGALTTPSTSHALYTSTGRLSAAVFGLSVGELLDEAIPCQQDPLPDNPAHALADYRAHDDKARKLISKRLKRKAMARGQLFP